MDKVINAANPEHKFQTALFNKVDTSSAASFVRPAGMQEKVWKAACDSNPDPSRLIPVSTNWFGDLCTRVEAQNERLVGHKVMLDLVEKRMTKISDSIETIFEPRLSVLRRRHRELTRRLLIIAVKAETSNLVRDDSAYRSSLTPDERNRLRQLETLQAEISAPGKFKDKLGDLSERAKSAHLDARNGTGGNLRDGRAAKAVKAVLTEQLDGIRKLHEVCEKTLRDVQIIEQGLNPMT